MGEKGSEGVGPRTPGQWPATESDGFNLPWALYPRSERDRIGKKGRDGGREGGRETAFL